MAGRPKDGRFFFRVDVGFWDHPKAIAAGRDGRGLYLCAIGWSRSQLTDGRIPAYVLPMLAFKDGMPIDSASAAADRLVEVGLWERTPDGWQIHDYAEHQQTTDDIEDQRARWRDRKNAQRSREAERTTQDVTGDSPVIPTKVTPPESESESESEKSPEKSPSSSSGPLTVVRAAPPQTTDDDRTRTIIESLGRADHLKALADGVAVRNKAKHLEACIRARWADAPAAQRLDAQHPDWTADQIASHIIDPEAALKAEQRARIDRALGATPWTASTPKQP